MELTTISITHIKNNIQVNILIKRIFMSGDFKANKDYRTHQATASAFTWAPEQKSIKERPKITAYLSGLSCLVAHNKSFKCTQTHKSIYVGIICVCAVAIKPNKNAKQTRWPPR